MIRQLTEEQLAVVRHPQGSHARVLAVAGSGKTTTMVERIKYLVRDLHVAPSSICVLMFNRRARLQFQDKLDELLSTDEKPQVNTFHSYAYGIISRASQNGLLPHIQDVWVGDKEEQTRIQVHKAIQALERRQAIPADYVDPEDALECIGLWKGSLIPPIRAGHRHNRYIPLVYAEFERIRLEKNAITFDDFVPIVVGLLEAESNFRGEYAKSYKNIIVDEYQDVNYGQQRLIELLAGDHADVMVVGDDDQTIYEWRGARSDYIRSEFAKVFSRRPCIDYTLSRTFRFGPVIAQCAQNTISLNRNRISKPIIAHAVSKHSSIQIIYDSSEQGTDINKALTIQIRALIKQTQNPQQVIVLARMFSQLAGLEAEFLVQKIPYRVIGRPPFFERREIVVLLDYLRLALKIHHVLDQNILNTLLSIANVPNRRLSRDVLTRFATQLGQQGATLEAVLQFFSTSVDSPFSGQQRESVIEFHQVIQRLHDRIMSESDLIASELLNWLIIRLGYNEHFDHYYGVGENSEDRKRSVQVFCEYALKLGYNATTLLEHIERLDTTRGVPEDQQVVMTTVFRVKGEEFDHVVLPQCNEGSMPCLLSSPNPIYDTQYIVTDPPSSDIIENERRLFYVALTRARHSVLIGASKAPDKGNQSISNPAVPSRFIEELVLSATAHVMSAIQRFASGEIILEELLRAVHCEAGHKQILNNLLQAYFPHCNIHLPPDIIERLCAVEPIEFQYANPPSQLRAKVETIVQAQKAWWDED